MNDIYIHIPYEKMLYFVFWEPLDSLRKENDRKKKVLNYKQEFYTIMELGFQG